MISYKENITRARTLAHYSAVVTFAVLLLSLASVFFIDQPLSNYFNDDGILEFRQVARRLTDIGLAENFFIISVMLFFLLHFVEVRRKTQSSSSIIRWLKRWSACMFFSLIFSGLCGHIIKFLVGRQRPHVSETFDAHVFSPFALNSYFQSMPSGHAQTLFCVATMLSLLWPRSRWYIYFVTLLLSFTRVIVHAHFLSDILVGALVGHLGTLWGLFLIEKYFPRRLSLLK